MCSGKSAWFCLKCEVLACGGVSFLSGCRKPHFLQIVRVYGTAVGKKDMLIVEKQPILCRYLLFASSIGL